uniref:SH2 domain-containing protein n=1 Tax=Fundulus heteroclitus TaxID=8078 RepID=A0A3Q2QTR4_FUNHE
MGITSTGGITTCPPEAPPSCVPALLPPRCLHPRAACMQSHRPEETRLPTELDGHQETFPQGRRRCVATANLGEIPGAAARRSEVRSEPRAADVQLTATPQRCFLSFSGPQFNSADRPGAQSWRPDASDPPRSKPPALSVPSSSVSRSNSSARGAPPSRFDGQREQTQDVHKHNTFPLQKSLPPRPGIPGPVPQHAGSLPPNIPSSGSLPQRLQSAVAEHRGSVVASSFPSPAAQGVRALDPQWYVGKVTRGQAEGCLKRVYKDGAYLVRDSTRQQPNQPFTLMVFYQDKVYNIQIRQQNQQFQLGTGLKAQEFFPSVSDIISHYSQSPLVLIDAKNKTSSHQNQCLLSDPAGYFMTGQNWS